jgi:threonine aldolase
VPEDEFLDACEASGVFGVPFGDHQVRFCTHWDVDREDVEEAVAAVADAAASLDRPTS